MEIIKARVSHGEGGVDDNIRSISLQPGMIIDCAAYIPPSRRSLSHGTPVDPDTMGPCIRPVQAQTRVNDRWVNHGSQPAVSLSSILRISVIWSLLHRHHPTFATESPYPLISRTVNAKGEPYIFTTTRAVSMLAMKGVGFLYGTDEPPASAAPFVERTDLAEWRAPEIVRWDYAGRTQVEDLPDNLLLLETAGEKARRYLEAFEQSSEHPLALQAGTRAVTFACWRSENL